MIELLIAILATYRISHFVAYDWAPFFLMKRLRDFTDKKRKGAQDRDNEYGLWATVDEVLRCPFCAGIYAALLCLVLISYRTVPGDIFLLWMAIAGGQSLLQGIEKER